MLTDTELIRKLDLFEGLNPKTIQRIAQLCIVREFGADEYLIRQGESGLGLYFITAGRVKVEIERSIEIAGEGLKSVKVVLNELTEVLKWRSVGAKVVDEEADVVDPHLVDAGERAHGSLSFRTSGLGGTTPFIALRVDGRSGLACEVSKHTSACLV